MDLSFHNFEEDPEILLSNEWLFYWNQLLESDEIATTAPDTLLPFTTNWATLTPYSAFGYATYYLEIILPAERPDLAFSVPDFYTSYTFYVNGAEFSRNGTVATSKETYTPYWLPKTKALGSFDADTLQLVLHVANFHHNRGGAYLPIKLGEVEHMFFNQYLEYGYSFVLTGALLMGGMFFLGLYLFGRHEYTILFFSLFCITYSFRILSFGSYALHLLLPDLPALLSLNLEYIALFLAGILFSLYTLYLYPKETSKTIIYIICLISVLFIVLTVILPLQYSSQLIIPYLAVLVLAILYGFWVYLRAALNKQPGANYSLFSYGVIIAVFIHNIAVYFGYLSPSLLINFVGYVFFFFFQSLVLSFRYTKNLKTALFRAEESARAKSQFLSTMSHEIRTPLNAVIGLSGLLSETAQNDQQLEYSTTIKKSGESLLSIINNILDFSKIESGSLELEEAEFSIVETTELVMDLIGSYTKKPNVELIYDIDEEVPEFLVGDATRLQQVLTNLVANAVKFTEEGEILVRIKVEKKLNESMVLRFEIKDTGIGIPADKLGRLFQSFSQVDASSTRKYGGTGLGLVISKRLIEAMNGEIWVTSTEGTGSTFSFIITLGLSNRIPTIPEFRILNNKNVFILDDNETNLRILKHHLVKARITVTTFKDPLLLLEKKDSLNEFDLGILDMQIPQKSGIDVAREIRELWDKKELPLVLFSSVHELENIEDRKLFNLYLRKPIQQSRFLINLEPLFNKARQKKVAEKNEMPSAHLFKKGVSILVAEDNKVNQKVILHILERLGITPQFAENGQIAAEMNATNNYDLILMDMEMPVMDGLEATKKILSDSSKSPVIIAMTANAMAEDKERCIKAGMDDFISKPVTVNSVKNLLTKWLGES